MIKSHDDRTRMTRIKRVYADSNPFFKIRANQPKSDLIRVLLPLKIFLSGSGSGL